MGRPKDVNAARRTVHSTTATAEEWELIRRFGRICRADNEVARKLLDSVGETPAPPPQVNTDALARIVAEVVTKYEAAKVHGG